jgi:hypothetical protein
MPLFDFKNRGLEKLGCAIGALGLLILNVCAGAAESPGWVPFAPAKDSFTESAIDLRFLNEKTAGEHGRIITKNGHFVHSENEKPIRFWAVNGPPSSVKEPGELKEVARALAKRGVNMVRIHGAVFTEEGEPDPKKVQQIINIVEAMKSEGIYSHASIYFPLWLRPKPELSWLKGYDGKKNPFAVLMFNREFQAKYRSWWESLLLTPGARSGKKLIDEAALMSVELQNEDSFFFWTFSEQNIPDEQLKILETEFGQWLVKKYGSLEVAFSKWNNLKTKRDAPGEGRVGFRPLWNMAHEKTLRDQDTAAFLLEVQTRFYTETIQFLRKIGFQGLVCASNWATASPEVLGPLEKMSYTSGDFIDRHGYFSCLLKGENSEWSIRNGHIYADRSALTFDPVEPGKGRTFVHPVMDPHYNNKPSMISETTWTRPNRFRSEAPLYFAAYGALQDSDAIVHFALDGPTWSVKPNYWMQPWTLMSPAMAGQFPAAALIFRNGLVSPGEVVAKVVLNKKELTSLGGTPLPQDAAFDELRLKDIPAGADFKKGQSLDPLLHYVGRTAVEFSEDKSSVTVNLGKGSIDHNGRKVGSSTGQLQLDYEKGTLTINAPEAQGASGNLKGLGECKLSDIRISSGMNPGHIILVSLDGQPIRSSKKMLLQVMSEEENSGWQTEPFETNKKKIVSIGTDPWKVKSMEGVVHLKHLVSEELKTTALDPNGYPVAEVGLARDIQLRPEIIYYLIH